MARGAVIDTDPDTNLNREHHAPYTKQHSASCSKAQHGVICTWRRWGDAFNLTTSFENPDANGTMPNNPNFKHTHPHATRAAN